MESAPQSTINHNAVIEFASDSYDGPTPGPFDTAGVQKGGQPCPIGAASNRPGPCQNHPLGATLGRAKTALFASPNTSFCGGISGLPSIEPCSGPAGRR